MTATELFIIGAISHLVLGTIFTMVIPKPWSTSEKLLIWPSLLLILIIEKGLKYVRPNR